MIKDTFISLARQYSDDNPLINDLWDEITDHYSGSERHYHSLQHLENLLDQLNMVKDDIKDWNAILFTLYYHDIIYNPLKNDNEEKSAATAALRMQALGVTDKTITACKLQIIATKQHLKSEDADTNYFTDADLAILGQSWEDYTAYYQNVRKEYSIYPALIYNAGRKKVLKHFFSNGADL